MALGTKQDVLQAMKRVYRYQAENQTRSVIRRSGKTRFIKDTDWERGVFWSCTAAAWKATGDGEYLDGVKDYALHTGFRTGPNARFADDHVCCQAYLDIYPEFNQPEALEPTIKALDIMVDSPELGRKDWWWCDSLFMAPPAFVALSKQTGNSKYLDYMNTAFWDSAEHLLDTETGLYYRDHRYIPTENGEELREENGNKVFWSRGIGWVLASVPRILANMPEDYMNRSEYITLFTHLAAEVIKYQQDDGFWRTSLLAPENFPAPESSATALFCYGLAWGVNTGELDKETYLPVIEKAWAALLECIHDNGMIGWVQLPAFNPRDVKFEHNIDYGAGAFMLAATEVAKLAE
ncbi:glycoside hydrolase family 105 protein [Aliivibrio finisterrensis]|uniref:glycoside hydrolase family 88/105 protein n=1 Tax=Aliivibrio finisterrensis TaxID=511998 RepID=UPI0010217BEB|nr:glycoside hydrolase family 88 protein [Aliivibrio finisterrensis]RYU68177.1 glycoside hydrolase family 105 protein [Aliivibrio finisterrensis]RYU71878.1 glycoside hydrolase family 105 protein [Aliivibrio finisterrensis]RYU75487.1 glycoside hydrolase family 105 protein [Aliivibrio finisterrensis]